MKAVRAGITIGYFTPTFSYNIIIVAVEGESSKRSALQLPSS
jgi:hypothetical protein